MIGALDTTALNSSNIVTQGTRVVQVAPNLFTSRGLARGPDDTTGPGFFFGVSTTAGIRKILSVLFRAQHSRKKITLRHAWVAVQSTSVASIITLDLVRLADKPIDFSTTSTTGAAFMTSNNPNTALVDASDPVFAALPTIAFIEGAVIGSTEFNLGITGAVSTNNPPTDVIWRDLLNPAGFQGNFTRGGFSLSLSTNTGLAIIIDTSTSTGLTLASSFDYVTEEQF